MLTFSSSLSSAECIQRLEKLVTRKHFFYSPGRFTIHVKFDSLITAGNSFQLLILCSPHRFELPAFIYFKFRGVLFPAENETPIQGRLFLDRPYSIGEWVFLVFWIILLALALLGGTISILTAPDLQAVLMALILVFAAGAYCGSLFHTYRLAKTFIPKLVFQVLQPEVCTTTQDKDSEHSEWVAGLSDNEQ